MPVLTADQISDQAYRMVDVVPPSGWVPKKRSADTETTESMRYRPGDSLLNDTRVSLHKRTEDYSSAWAPSAISAEPNAQWDKVNGVYYNENRQWKYARHGSECEGQFVSSPSLFFLPVEG